MEILLYILGGLIVLAGILVYAFETAEEGWEDERGYHKGKDPRS